MSPSGNSRKAFSGNPSGPSPDELLYRRVVIAGPPSMVKNHTALEPFSYCRSSLSSTIKVKFFGHFS
jgi:hypothetical protein